MWAKSGLGIKSVSEVKTGLEVKSVSEAEEIVEETSVSVASETLDAFIFAKASSFAWLTCFGSWKLVVNVVLSFLLSIILFTPFLFE